MINDAKAIALYNETSAKDQYMLSSFKLDWNDLPEITKNVYRYHASKQKDDDIFSDFDQTFALIVSRTIKNFVDETNRRDECFLEHSKEYSIIEITRAFPRDKWEEQSLLWCSRVLEQYAKASYGQLPLLKSDATRAMLYIAANFTSLYL